MPGPDTAPLDSKPGGRDESADDRDRAGWKVNASGREGGLPWVAAGHPPRRADAPMGV